MSFRSNMYDMSFTICHKYYLLRAYDWLFWYGMK